MTAQFSVLLSRACIERASIVETLIRSVNTSFTVILFVLALFLIGGASIHYFVLVLLIGVITGTYSSIFNASQLLVVWETGKWRGHAKSIPATEEVAIEHQG